MTDTFLFAQTQPFTLAGAGANIGDQTIVLSSFNDIDGNPLTMVNFGTKCFGTLEPGNGIQEEQIYFTYVHQNSNGTCTLGYQTTNPITSVAFTTTAGVPYVETTGLTKTHAGGTVFVISNTAGFYDRLTSKNDDETIAGDWTFSTKSPTVPTELSSEIHRAASIEYVNSTTTSGAPNASTSVKGIVQEATQAQADAKTNVGSTGAELYVNPATQRAVLISDIATDTGAADAYAIAPSPAITAYVIGQIFTFKSTHTNTTASTLAVSGLTATAIKKGSGAVALVAGDIVSGQIVQVEYDGTNFQMLNPVGNSPMPLGYLDTTVTLGGSDTKVPSQNAVKTFVDNKLLKTVNGVATVSNNSTTTITCGFLPKLVRVSAVNNATDFSNGSSDGTNNKCVYVGTDSAGAGVKGTSTSYAFYLAEGVGGGQVGLSRGTFDNFTSTGFDIVIPNLSPFLASSYIQYEVIGY